MELSKYQVSLGKLALALRNAQIPFGGINPRPTELGEKAHFREFNTGWHIELIFLPETSERDKQTLLQIVDGFEFEEREAKPDSDVRSDVGKLTNVQKDNLLSELLLEKLKTEPTFATRLGVNLEPDAKKPKGLKLKRDSA